MGLVGDGLPTVQVLSTSMPLPERLVAQIERASTRQLSEMDTQRVIDLAPAREGGA